VRRKDKTNDDCVFFIRDGQGDLKEVKRLENIKSAAMRVSARTLVVRDNKDEIQVYSVTLREGECRLEPRCSLGVFKGELASIVLTPNGRFAVVGNSGRCQVLDTTGMIKNIELPIEGGFNWAISDDGTQVSALYRKDLSSTESYLRVFKLR
jgi:hypothetical protein